jgi:hypothetical protein
VIEYLHGEHYIGFEIPRWLSLGLIVVIFGVALVYSRRVERKRISRDEQRASRLLNDQ